MSFFPAGFDPRDPAAGLLRLASLETPDGVHGFMIGTDGRFVSSDGRVWFGSQLISAGDTEMAIGGTAPSGNLSLSFLQDDQAPDLITEIRALGVDYVAGRKIRFYVQPLAALEEFWAPVLAPVLFATRTLRKISTSASGAQDRSISVSFEGPFEFRNGMSRLIYNTADHSLLVGAANPSLTFIPTDNRRDEKIWG